VNLTDVIERALARNSSDTETHANTEMVARQRDHARWQLASIEAAPAANDRDWWLEQAAKAGADWRGILDGCRDLLAIGVGENSEMDMFKRACRGADGRAAARPRDADLDRLRLDDKVTLPAAWAAMFRNRPTPEATAEAIKQAVRDRGLAALKEPATRARVQRCDADARGHLDVWISNFKKRNLG
jgi:hypothetical protein